MASSRGRWRKGATCRRSCQRWPNRHRTTQLSRKSSRPTSSKRSKRAKNRKPSTQASWNPQNHPWTKYRHPWVNKEQLRIAPQIMVRPSKTGLAEMTRCITRNDQTTRAQSRKSFGVPATKILTNLTMGSSRPSMNSATRSSSMWTSLRRSSPRTIERTCR